jgi:hypothetical protein
VTALHIEAHRGECCLGAAFPVQSSYVERFWLPALGPTTTLLARLLDQLLDSSSDRPVCSPLPEVGAMLGVGQMAKMRTCVERLRMASIEVAEDRATFYVAVPRLLPAVPVRHHPKWPAGLAALHDVAAEIFAEPLNSTSEQSISRA